MAAALPQGTVTFLFTDIEGSTQLVRDLGSEYGRVRSEHRRVLREAFARHGGHEVDTAGDGFFVVFERAGDAVAAAVEAQRALPGAPVRVRMGIHTAEPHLDDEGYVGVGVHRAERICSAGHGGQILLSNATAGIVEDLGPQGLELRDLGEYRLKGMVHPQRLFQVVGEGLPGEFPPLRSLDSAHGQPAVVTVMETDLVGWLGLLRALGDERAADVVAAYHSVVTSVVEAERGRVVELVGDHALAVFDRPRDAVRAAVALRESLRTEPWTSAEQRLPVRLAVHSGWVADPSARSLGAIAFRCSSLNKQGEPWQILVSHATHALLVGERSGIELRDVGERTVADFDRPVHVFDVVAE